MPSAIVADARVQVARNGTIGYGLPAWLAPALREAVETYGANGDRRREARAITSLATTHGMVGDVPDAFVIDLATQGATLAESAGDLATASIALVRAGITHLEGGDVITAGHVLERALALAARARNGSAITDATSILGITRFTQQRWAEAHALFHSLAGRGAAAAFMPQVWEARTNLALGRWESARTILDRARGHADRLGDAMMRAVATFWLGEVARAAGDRDDAAALYAEALAVMNVPDALGHYSRAHLGLAILADEAGDIAGARTHLVAATEAPAETLSLQLPEMLATIAGIVAKHDPHVAALAWASAQAIMAQTRTNPVIPHDATRVGAIVDAVRIHLGDGAMASPPTTNDAAIALARTAVASLPS
jgi:tetratricopeptide (TPR) repeat protein